VHASGVVLSDGRTLVRDETNFATIVFRGLRGNARS
jgi:hypothetical protein